MTKLEQACEKYLAEQPFTLWANWEIKHPDRRKQAAKWLAAQIRGVAEVEGRSSDSSEGVTA